MQTVKALANAAISTGLFAAYSYDRYSHVVSIYARIHIFITSRRNSRAVSDREQLERFDKRIKQELAACASKRELLTTTLDNLDR
jgi:hypothetical protein